MNQNRTTVRRSLGVATALAGAATLSAPVVLPRVTPAAAAVSHHVRIAVQQGSHANTTAGWASSNWSGYAITGGPFTRVTAKWRVPSVSATSRASYSAAWVGIDGFNDANLIQTGTEQDYYSGRAHYYAWWEILPAAETPINSVPVHPGDVMTASISHGAGSSWTITISDTTDAHSYTTHQSYSAPLSSAEWIQEAPTVGSQTGTLAHYKAFAFDPGTANGVSPHFVSASSGVLIQAGRQVSTPSAPDNEADGFSIAYGASTPAPPAS